MSNLRKDIHIKAQIKTEAHSRDFFFLTAYPFLTLFSPGIPFPHRHIPPSCTIFCALLEHDKSKRGVMTQDPLLALKGGRKGKNERKEGRRGELRERKDERDLSGNYCSQGIDSLL